MELAQVPQQKGRIVKSLTGSLLVLLTIVACGREPAETLREVPPTSGGEGGESAVASGGGIGSAPASLGGASSVAGAEAAPELLGASHPGYQQPLCFDCHGSVAPYPHGDASYRPPDCAGCHGNNGAPRRDHAVMANPGCPNCHGQVPHVSKLVAPADCVKCHQAT